MSPFQCCSLTVCCVKTCGDKNHSNNIVREECYYTLNEKAFRTYFETADFKSNSVKRHLTSQFGVYYSVSIISLLMIRPTGYNAYNETI